MCQLGQPSGSIFLEVFEVSGAGMAPRPNMGAKNMGAKNMGAKNMGAKNWLTIIIVSTLRIRLGPLSFKVLCLLKSDEK